MHFACRVGRLSSSRGCSSILEAMPRLRRSLVIRLAMLWFAILQLVLYQFVTPDVVNTMSNLFLRLPFSRRMEIEADHIGLLLVASVGYDPRVCQTVYEKLSKVTGGDSALRDYLSTHPSGKKRAELLARAKIMEEALAIYRDVKAGRRVEGFLLDSL